MSDLLEKSKDIESFKDAIFEDIRPWGKFRSFPHKHAHSIKIITIESGEALSLQYHSKRSEFWVILDEGLEVTVGKRVWKPHRNEEIFIPRDTPHRVRCLSQESARIMEIWIGKSDESDIVRLEDAYDRKQVRKKILLVDDDRVTLTMLEMILSRHKYQVFSAEDGSEGLELTIKERPDVVISDMLIPKIHGLDLCKKIKQDPDLNQIKVIMMTAVYKGISFKFEAKKYGADHFIEKPIDTNELLAVLDKLLGNSSVEDFSK